MEDKFHMFIPKSPLSKDQICQVWCHLVEQFYRRLKCDDGHKVTQKAHLFFGQVS